MELSSVTPIFLPILAMTALIFVVWLSMFLRHLIYLRKNGISAQKIATPEQVVAIFPEQVRLSGNNLRNLFELPVVFFVICLSLAILRLVDSTFVTAAWCYVAFRIVHSLIHCTINHVDSRFTVWFLSCLVLWFMAGRLLLMLIHVGGNV